MTEHPNVAREPFTGVQIRIGVMGSAGDPLEPFVAALCRRLGRAIAGRGCCLLTGACPGLPHEAVLGAKGIGGHVVGISPASSLREHVEAFGSPYREYIRWYSVDGPVDLSHESRSLAFRLRDASQGDDDIYVMVNGYWEALDFTVPDGVAGEWRRVVDTGRESPDDIREPAQEAALVSPRYPAPPRSMVVLVRPRRV